MQQMTELPCPYRKDIKCCQENKFKKGKIYVTIKKNKELEEKNYK